METKEKNKGGVPQSPHGPDMCKRKEKEYEKAVECAGMEDRGHQVMGCFVPC